MILCIRCVGNPKLTWEHQHTIKVSKQNFCYFRLLMIFEDFITSRITPLLDTYQKIHTAHFTGGSKFGFVQGSIGKAELVLKPGAFLC